jgi:hypothetical protein
MPIEGWRSLIESTNWKNCNIILHNFPIKSLKPVTIIIVTGLSSYELQKSAIYWTPPDFKVLSNR